MPGQTMETTKLLPSAEDIPASKALKPLSTFTRLSTKVSIYEPPPSSTIHSSPTTILFFSWLNANPKHIEKYASYYKRLYPDARIILTTVTTVDFLASAESTRRKLVAPAISALLSSSSSGEIEKEERILVHSCSSGGSKMFYALCGAYASKTGKPFPATSVIFDSAPGIPRFRRDLHALFVPARRMNWGMWIPYAIIMVAITSVVFVIINWMPKWFWRNLVWGPRDGLNDRRVLKVESVRGYVYSKVDQAIDFRDVELHAEDARKNGYRVLAERVEGEEAEHVQMWKGKWGEEGYLRFIERVWRIGTGFE